MAQLVELLAEPSVIYARFHWMTQQAEARDEWERPRWRSMQEQAEYAVFVPGVDALVSARATVLEMKKEQATRWLRHFAWS